MKKKKKHNSTNQKLLENWTFHHRGEEMKAPQTILHGLQMLGGGPDGLDEFQDIFVVGVDCQVHLHDRQCAHQTCQDHRHQGIFTDGRLQLFV